ncbi:MULTISPECIES: bifunctional oligoribonuclease/PAP phosphatase NrnA [unclassified Enterococcus]|uniref:DHH family phosphoesterase n=1 Tax=unclassified Enterococcus TaxID=2608891 RepID=UPI0015557328|nr:MULTISPECIES: bifunctional oligoribonuclease/PAP phosphatase NrnA [unclassified Enterococcus]MBS7576619.1 bifunctional oligoribonuclease/PAP phosphatase NrnA [Enterococcus sp. MMGLQ5-2]MBS7583894.1 bifunctional oligoribonuclease/PAP phosphatase NrnA [Enterococcus sp. MMGLQ5-1]NPD11755.1 bifunctional oligoribonuclease/PAP phosphatase NrnA [Enterococcus sp. MMGLQ5-1]NPD36456.1 bifunctional oligoribonuclease/PAP phosphatase NrnA [Enterococcus sp. MMGLQ5-2]
MSLSEQILSKIKEYQKIIIHRHMNPDPDALGSQLGLKALIKTNFPEKKVFAAGGPVNDLDFLGVMDSVEIEDYQDALVIICDTGNTPRISGAEYQYGAYLIKIDHHPNDDPYGDLLWVDTTSSSTSELIALWARELNLKLTQEAARLLYAGIVGDTGRFLYPATTSRTLQLAADLISTGFDFAKLNQQIDGISVKVARLIGYVYENLICDEYGTGKVILSQAILDEFQLADHETSAIVGVPGRIETVLTWGIFVEQKDGHYRCRLRSKGPRINEVAKRHDGGGHPLASGANAKDLAEVEAIYKELQVLTKEFNYKGE